MKRKHVDNKEIHVGGNLTGDSILGDGNVIHKPTVNNNIDGGELGYSLGEALAESAREAEFWERHHESDREETRKILETVYVSVLSGVVIGALWQLAAPWNAITAPFVVILTTLTLTVIRAAHFGVRQTIMTSLLIGTAYSLLITHVEAISTWMTVNQFVGIAVLGALGAVIGLVTGIILLFWKPLGD
jgi:hypothetical protein